MVFFVSILVLWVISLCLHEWAHARVALAGGDTSVIEKGYLTLNPLRYMHPMMSFVIPLIILIIGGVPLPGGAVWIDTSRLRSPNWMSLVSAAGPAANLVLLVLCGLPFAFGLHENPDYAGTSLIFTLAFFGFLMAFAAVINLLPFPGLDGFGIIEPHLPPNVQRIVRENSRYALFLLIAILIFPNPVRDFIYGITIFLTLQVGIPLDEFRDAYSEFFRIKDQIF